MPHVFSRLALVASAFAVAALTAGSMNASSAAVRLCKAPLAATGTHPQNELDARKAALVQWTQAARVYGDGYTSWRLADQRSLTCSTAAAGVLCQAVGAPCTISQTPSLPGHKAPREPGKKPTDV